MSLKVKFIEGCENKGYCKYYQADCTLLYEISPQKIDINHKLGFLLIYDTLTIEFDAEKKFRSFDVYTNKEYWECSETIILNKIDGIGTLYLSEGFENEDRYSFKIIPNFEFSNDGKLKIKLSNEINPKIYQISNNLIAGIENQLITSLIVTDIDFS